ncbi:jg27497, partial [Pararge aegeria aegeria]
ILSCARSERLCVSPGALRQKPTAHEPLYREDVAQNRLGLQQTGHDVSGDAVFDIPEGSSQSGAAFKGKCSFGIEKKCLFQNKLENLF